MSSLLNHPFITLYTIYIYIYIQFYTLHKHIKHTESPTSTIRPWSCLKLGGEIVVCGSKVRVQIEVTRKWWHRGPNLSNPPLFISPSHSAQSLGHIGQQSPPFLFLKMEHVLWNVTATFVRGLRRECCFYISITFLRLQILLMFA